MLVIKSFTKEYSKGTKAVDGLSIHVEKGDIYGFIGHNGAGKTTTLKAVAGIIDFNEGEIFVDGLSVQKNPVECKSKLAYIPDNPDLYEFMTGIKYLNFIADMFSIPSDIRAEKIKKYSTMFELEDNLSSLIGSYSHGMKQKLALISALIHDPKLLLLDEPFVGLDPKASHLLKETMKEMVANGASIFFSTHVLEVAEKLCTKIAIIKSGKLIESGATSDIIGKSSLEDIFLEITNSYSQTLPPVR